MEREGGTGPGTDRERGRVTGKGVQTDRQTDKQSDSTAAVRERQWEREKGTGDTQTA